jgi:putative transposase
VAHGELYRRTHKARLYPSPAQIWALDRQGHTARALWNLLHEWYTCRYGGIAKRPSVSRIDQQLRDARANPLHGWEFLSELPAQATQQVLKHYLDAWNRCFSRVSKPPKLSRHWGEVTIPLIGRVRFHWTRSLPGTSRVCPGRITGARLIKDPVG